MLDARAGPSDMLLRHERRQFDLRAHEGLYLCSSRGSTRAKPRSTKSFVALIHSEYRIIAQDTKIWPQILLDVDRHNRRRARMGIVKPLRVRGRVFLVSAFSRPRELLLHVLPTISADFSLSVATTRVTSLSLLFHGPVGQHQIFTCPHSCISLLSLQ